MKRFKKLRKRVTAFIAAVIISLMSLFDCGIYRPMEAYAASVTAGGLALLADILFGLGLTFAGAEVVKQTAADIASYADTEAEELSTSGKTTIHYSAAGVEHGGSGKSFELTASDVSTAKSVLDGDIVVNKGDAIPLGFVNTIRAWAVKRANISAIDGSAAFAQVMVPAKSYYDSKYTRVNGLRSKDGLLTLSATGDVWGSYGVTGASIYWGTLGSVVTCHNAATGLDTVVATLSSSITNSGYTRTSLKSDFMAKFNVVYEYPSSADVSNYIAYPVIVRTLNPTVDVAFANAISPTWDGEADLDATLAAQNAAVTAGTKDDYVSSVITGSGGGTTTSDGAYKQLNYVLGVLGGYWGLTGVTSTITDAFIADMYKDYVHGSSAEKLEQAEAVRDKFVVVNGTGGNNDDNNNKDFKVLNTLVNAYLACLIANKLLPEGTPELAPETQINNVEVVDKITTPDPSPGIDLSGILSWLSKIYNGIISIPQHITSIGDKILNIPKAISESKLGQWVEGIKDTLSGIPEAISNSRLGQWVKSIPEILLDIKTKILEIPQLLPDILSAIQALPDSISNFFTLDTVQIGAAYNGMSDAFKSKFSVLNQIGGMFNSTGRSFADTPPVIKMQTPDALKFAIKEDQMVVMDLTKYANLFIWCRGLLTATIWVAFAKWLLDQFNVNFHVG